MVEFKFFLSLLPGTWAIHINQQCQWRWLCDKGVQGIHLWEDVVWRHPTLSDRVWSVLHVCGASRNGRVNCNRIIRWGGNRDAFTSPAVVMGLPVALLNIVLGNLQEIQENSNPLNQTLSCCGSLHSPAKNVDLGSRLLWWKLMSSSKECVKCEQLIRGEKARVCAVFHKILFGKQVMHDNSLPSSEGTWQCLSR